MAIRATGRHPGLNLARVHCLYLDLGSSKVALDSLDAGGFLVPSYRSFTKRMVAPTIHTLNDLDLHYNT